MIQILIWGVCFLMIGLGVCGQYLAQIVKGQEKTEATGMIIFLFMIIAAVIIFGLSLSQGNVIADLLKKWGG